MLGAVLVEQHVATPRNPSLPALLCSSFQPMCMRAQRKGDSEARVRCSCIRCTQRKPSHTKRRARTRRHRRDGEREARAENTTGGMKREACTQGRVLCTQVRPQIFPPTVARLGEARATCADERFHFFFFFMFACVATTSGGGPTPVFLWQGFVRSNKRRRATPPWR